MKYISQKKFQYILKSAAAEYDFPVHGYFELTPFCNLDCKMCYVHRDDTEACRKMLSGTQWIGLIDEAVDYGMMSCVLTGGEAMTHPDFWRIYLHLMNCGVSVTLKTNGLLLNAETLARLVEYPPKTIDVSLYGWNDDSYMAVSGHRVFDTVQKNIIALKDTGIFFRLMITPSKYMLPFLDDILEFAKQIGVKTVINALMLEPNDQVGNLMDDYNLNVEQQIEITKKSRELFPPKLMSISEEEEIYGKKTERKDEFSTGLQCYGGRTTFAIHWDGVMSPCLSYPEELVFGNPLKDGFGAAWRLVNEHVKSFDNPRACLECEIKDNCHYCPGMHGKRHALHRICNPNVCTYFKRIERELPRPEREEKE